MSVPTFSIVTVVRNAESEIAKTLASVSAQTCQDYEHLIIDGLSTDQTLKIINNHMNERMVVKSESDRGLYDAMNKGIEMSNGNHLIFLNAGDIFCSNDVLDSVKKSIVREDSLYFGKMKIVGGKYRWEIGKNIDRDSMSFYDLPHHQSVFYPKNYYKYNRYDTSKIVQADIKFTALACKILSAEFLNIYISVSELGGYSILILKSWKKTLNMCREIVTIKSEIDGDISFFEIFITYTKQIYKYLCYNFVGERFLYWSMSRRAVLS